MTQLLLGVGLGWAAGLTPGPLHTLIMVTAMKRGFAAGARVAFAPPLADIPVVPISLIFVGAMSDGVVRVLSFAGGLFVLWLGYDTMRQAHREELDADAGGSDLMKGVVTNLLSPHPWLFWFVVAAPLLIEAWNEAPWRAVAFMVGFYGTMVSVKLVVAWLASHGRRLVGSPWYPRLIVSAGAILLVMGVLLIADAVRT